MIRFIAALDSKNGMANEQGIPWQGKVPEDVSYFREHTVNSNVLMGYATYLEFEKPLSGRRNFVASTKAETLRAGFELVNDARSFLENFQEDIWVIGGPGLFAATLDLADELYLTRLNKDFACTKFFPNFEVKFTLKTKSKEYIENDVSFYFEIWEKVK